MTVSLLWSGNSLLPCASVFISYLYIYVFINKVTAVVMLDVKDNTSMSMSTKYDIITCEMGDHSCLTIYTHRCLPNKMREVRREFVKTFDFTFGCNSIVLFFFSSCDIRTQFQGDSFHATCLDTGRWSHPPPTCWGESNIEFTSRKCRLDHHYNYVHKSDTETGLGFTFYLFYTSVINIERRLVIRILK